MAQSWPNIDIRTLHGEFGFFAVGKNSTVTDTGCVLHCDGIDTTTLSAECQQPCQPNAIRVAETLKPVAPQRFSRHRRVFEGNPVDPRSWAVQARCQGFANSAPRVRNDDHTSEACDAEMKGLSSTLQPAPDQPGRDRTVFPWLAGRVEPSHQSVNNPLTKVSTTLQLQVRHNVRERGYHLPTGYTRKQRTSK